MRRTAVAIALLGLTASGCPRGGDPPPGPAPATVASATPTQPAADSSLRWAINEPTAIIPIDAVTPDDLVLVDALYDSLTAWGADLAPVPSAAVRWASSRGGTVWRFWLRRTGAFHDGTPVTAGHFVDTWNVMAARGAAHHHLRDVVGYAAVRAGRADRLAGLRAVGDQLLEIRLGRPQQEWPAVVAHPALAPLAHPDRPSRMQPVGNGPFRIGEPWARGRFLRLARARPVADNARPGRALDEVVFQVLDPTTAYIAFMQGRVDVATLPPGAVDRRRFPTSTRYTGPGLLRGTLPTTYFLVFNTSRPPFDRVGVRRAIAMALDRRSLVRGVFGNNARSGASLASAAVPGGRQRSCLACVHDPGAATSPLRAAGVDRVDLWISEGGDHERVAARVQADLAAVNVNVRVRTVPFGRFHAALAAGRPGLYRFGWTADYPTLDNALRPLVHSTSTPASGGANYSRYADPRVDRLLDRAAATADEFRRVALYRRAEDIALGEQQVVVPLVTLRRSTAVADRVRGLVYGPMGTTNLPDVRMVERRR